LAIYLLLLGRAFIDANAEVVRVHTVFGRHQIYWDEVKVVESDTFGNTFVLCGDDKRLPISLQSVGRSKKDLVNLIQYQIDQRGISQIHPTRLVMRPKNTKLRKE
jgi:hypothetical protein